MSLKKNKFLCKKVFNDISTFLCSLTLMDITLVQHINERLSFHMTMARISIWTLKMIPQDLWTRGNQKMQSEFFMIFFSPAFCCLNRNLKHLITFIATDKHTLTNKKCESYLLPKLHLLLLTWKKILILKFTWAVSHFIWPSFPSLDLPWNRRN